MTTEQTGLTIGQTVSRAQAEALPVGSVLHAPSGGGYNLTKQAGGMWDATGGNGRFSTDDLTPDYNTLVRIGSESEPPRWIIGQTVSRADAEAMPVGTVIRATEAYHPYDLTKQESGEWHTESEGSFTSDQLSEDYNVLVSLPSESEGTRFTVGQRLTTDADLAEVPMGTVIRAGEHSSLYRRVEGGYVNVTNEHHVLGLDLFTPGVFSIVTLPEEASDSEVEWTVGQVLTANEQFNLLPVGTVIRNSEGERYEMLTGHRNRNLVNGRVMGNGSRRAAVLTYTIESLPGDEWVIGERMQAGVPGRLPVGSIVFQTGHPDLRYRRLPDGWENVEEGTHYDTYIIGDSASYTLESVGPEQEVTSLGEWTVGMTLTAEQIGRLPVGSVLDRGTAGFHYEKRVGGWYSVDATSGYSNDVRISAPNSGTLLRLPALGSDSEGNQVGQGVQNLEHMQSLPIGTVLRYYNGAAYTVADGHRLHRETDGRYFDMAGRAYHRYQIESLPQFTVGQVLVEQDQFRAVPVGAVIVHTTNQAALYERTEAGYRNVSLGFDYSLDAFAFGAGDYRIHSLPDHVEPEVLEATETFEQYVQRFRVTVLGAAQGSSVALDPIYEGFQSLNAPDPERSVGMYVHYYDEDFNSGLPSGTVALFTQDNGQVTIVGWTGYAWELLSGHGGYHQGPMKVVTLPGGDTLEWVTREPTEEDARRIEDFKSAAKVFGRGAKSSQGWCGVYERTMQVMGIDA